MLLFQFSSATPIGGISDYNELIAFSVAINLTYIIVTNYIKKGVSPTPFFDLLSKYGENTLSRIILKKTMELNALEEDYAKNTYYLSQKKLSSDNESVIRKICDIYEEIKKTVDHYHEIEITKVKEAVNLKFYSHLSFLLAGYGFFLLFLAPLEVRMRTDLRACLYYTNYIVFTCTFLFSLWEFPRFIFNWKNNKIQRTISKILNWIFKSVGHILKPRYSIIPLLGVTLIAVFAYFIWWPDREVVSNRAWTSHSFLVRNSIVFALIICFSNFLFYLIFTSLRLRYSERRFKKSLNKLGIEKSVEQYQKLEKDAKDEMERNPLEEVKSILKDVDIIN